MSGNTGRNPGGKRLAPIEDGVVRMLRSGDPDAEHWEELRLVSKGVFESEWIHPVLADLLIEIRVVRDYIAGLKSAPEGANPVFSGGVGSEIVAAREHAAELEKRIGRAAEVAAARGDAGFFEQMAFGLGKLSGFNRKRLAIIRAWLSLSRPKSGGGRWTRPTVDDEWTVEHSEAQPGRNPERREVAAEARRWHHEEITSRDVRDVERSLGLTVSEG